MTPTANLPTPPRGREAPVLGAGALVYIAAPKSEYESPRYARLLKLTERRFRDAELIEARTAFSDITDWRTNWPALLTSLSALVFFTTPDGWIGRGVWAEIREARAKQLPVYHITDAGALVPANGLSFSLPNPQDWTTHVRVTARKGA